MRKFVLTLAIACAFPLAGCNENGAKPTPPAEEKKVEVQAPGAEVKTDDKGKTEVKTPGADVDVKPK